MDNNIEATDILLKEGERLFGVRESAQLLGVSRILMQQLIRSGKIKSVIVGEGIRRHTRRTKLEWLNDYLNERNKPEAKEPELTEEPGIVLE